jgi:uncharacterized heparinase superfamily protein
LRPPEPGRAAAGKPGPLRQVRDGLMRNLFATSLYRLSLPRSGPTDLAAQPADPWPGDTSVANDMFQGRYRFAGQEIHQSNQPPWTQAPPSAQWQLEASSFGWLRHFGAGGGAAARQGARELVRSWIVANEDFDPLTWAPEVMGRRLMAWTSHAAFLLEDADPPFRQVFLSALDRQARHLGRAWSMAPPGADRLAALAGLMLASATLDPTGRRANNLIHHVTAEVSAQVMADGGHVSRNPSELLETLRTLIWLNTGLEAAAVPVPTGVPEAIARMAPMLAFFRHGDGGFCLFNGSSEDDRARIDQTLDLCFGNAAKSKRPLAVATHSGFERMMAGKSIALVDTGKPPNPPFDGVAHAGTLSFEFSVAKHRIIVNCGHRPGADWSQASRATAAHSTVTVGNTNSSQISGDGVAAGPMAVNVHRKEDEGNLWLDLEHDGYVARSGLYHRRRLYLSADGGQLRGEDVIEGARTEGRVGLPITARFHLHPDVHASHTSDGALLKLGNGQGWQFRAAGGVIALEESIYLGGAGEVRRAEQITISAEVEAGGTSLKWALAKI